MSFPSLNPRIVFCGSSVWDLAVDVERQPRPGQKARGRLRWEGPGGHAFNAASVAARLGEEVLLLSHAGYDSRGVQLREWADQTPGLYAIWSDMERTNTSMVMHLGGGPERTIISVREPSLDGTPGDGSRAMLHDAHWTDLYWYEGQEEWALSVAAMNGGNLSASVDCAKQLVEWGYRLGLVIDSLESTQRPPLEWLQANVDRCVLTAGERGGEWWTPQTGWQYFNVQSVQNIVSTCGAGDAFRAGLIVSLEAGLELPQAIQRASWCGAQALGWPGGVPGGDLSYPGEYALGGVGKA